jgi:tRNA (mo5U34)-methyltransferase
MIDYQPLLAAMSSHTRLRQWAEQLPEQINQGLSPEKWGDLPKWQAALGELPSLTARDLDFKSGVKIGATDDCDEGQRQAVKTALMKLHPWRKGPFDLFGLGVDAEWRSDRKWQRVFPALEPLEDRLVLDVGCGNGYYCWRMLGAGAQRVIGIDPSPLFVHQFYAVKNYALLAGFAPAIDVLPLGIENLPNKLQAFDTVFAMGILYHRRSPMDTLLQLRDLLRPGGQLVLETLVIDDQPPGQVLVPEGRYASMANVWFIPSPSVLTGWLRKCGFKNPVCVDVCTTTTNEQRTTEWMTFQSLEDFLNKEDPQMTIEGHPAPCRGVFTATV